MFENAFWKLYFKLEHQAQEHDRKAWNWIRSTYDARVDLYTERSVYEVKIITFTPTERKTLWSPRYPISDRDTSVLVKRKAITFGVEAPGVEAFERMKDGGMIPWMEATLWKRSGKRDSAGALGIKEAIVVDGSDHYQGITFYYVVCRDIIELESKSLVPVPLWVQAS